MTKLEECEAAREGESRRCGRNTALRYYTNRAHTESHLRTTHLKKVHLARGPIAIGPMELKGWAYMAFRVTCLQRACTRSPSA